MANRNSAGFGLVEAMRVGNTPSIQGQSKYEIDAGETNAIFHGEPVKVDISASNWWLYCNCSGWNCYGWCFKWSSIYRCYYKETNF